MKKTLVLILLLISLTACHSTVEDIAIEIAESDGYWPTNGWLTAEPEKFGMDSKKLADAAKYIEDNNIDIHSVLVVKNGYLVAEYYFNGFDEETPHIQYSVTKSFASAMVGIALEDGYIQDINQTLEEFFPEYNYEEDGVKEITLENILTMQTGLGWIEGNTGYLGLMSADDAVEYMLKLPLVTEPGENFAYCSGCSYLLSAIVEKTSGKNTAEYAQEKLFDPIGIEKPEWETVNGTPNGGWGLFLTPREMAKFGYLYLNGGEWDGEQIIPAEWVDASSDPGRKADQYSDYGYQWWISQEGYYSAQGLYGQAIFVIPEHDMVVVMTADLQGDNIEYWLLHEYILEAVE